MLPGRGGYARGLGFARRAGRRRAETVPTGRGSLAAGGCVVVLFIAGPEPVPTQATKASTHVGQSCVPRSELMIETAFAGGMPLR